MIKPPVKNTSSRAPLLIRGLCAYAVLILILGLCAAYLCPAYAAEPFSWVRKPNQAAPAQLDTYHGETLDFRCTFAGFGELPFAGASTPRLYYQTNGMGAAWWSLPATVSSNVLTATFPPAADPGADRLSVFFGAPSNAYAAAQVRFRNSPGAHPNNLEPPSVLDWQAELAAATNALVWALTTGDVDKQIKVHAAQNADFAESAYSASTAMSANDARDAEYATYAANLGTQYDYRTAANVISQLDAATETNDLQSAAIAGIPAAMTNIAEVVAADSTNALVEALTTDDEDRQIEVNHARFANWAGDAYSAESASHADGATYAANLGEEGSANRTAAAIFAQLDAAVSNGGLASNLTVGTRNGDYQRGYGSFTVGTNNAADGLYSFSAGQNNRSKGVRSVSLGISAWATNNSSVVFNTGGTPYGSHGPGTFNINPINGAFGFWIGDQTLYDVFLSWLTATNSTTVAIYDGDELLDERTVEPPNLAFRADVEAARREASASFRLFQGSNLVVTITNYNSAVNPPEMSYQQLDESNEYHTVWTETNGLTRTLNKAKKYTDDEISSLNNTYAPRSWSKVTSGMGVEAPSNTTWISTERTVLAGGYEPEKHITTGGEIWIITTKGTVYNFSPNSSNTAYLNIAAADGTPLFRIEKTDSYLVGVDCDAVSVEGSTLVCGIHLVANDHPYARVKQNIRDASWAKEEDSIPASLATVSWTQDGDWWYCSVQNNTGGSSIFAYFEYLQEGGTKIVNESAMDMSGGLVVNGVHYSRLGTTTVNGKTVLTLEN